MKSVLAALLFISGSATAMEALPKQPPIPKDNPQTPEKIELGKTLWFDPRLSVSGTISCNSCHNIMGAGDDGRPVSIGVHGQLGGVGAPTVWNSAYNTVQFWDGRAGSLEEQAKGPLVNDKEMGMKDHDMAVGRIRRLPGYVTQFKKVFPTDPDPVSIDNIARALASFERTLITPDSPFDLFKRGNKKAMSEQALRGMKLVEQVGCTSCHTGPNFNGEGFAMGEGNFQPFPQIPGSKFDTMYKLTDDLGRFNVTKNVEDKNKWRVPTWRNVALTAPYFHNGEVKTLQEAVRVMAKTQLAIDLNDEQVADIVEFLNALTGKFPKLVTPRLPELANETLTPDR